MCDGAFSVEGQEKIQEILYKRLTLCQFITGLSLCRVNYLREKLNFPIWLTGQSGQRPAAARRQFSLQHI
jgi:hypothetical protein